MKYNFKFLQTGGVPLTNDLMALIEEAYSIFEVLGDLAGDKTILKGCETIGSNVNPGIVAIEGKLYYFEGGLASSTVFINVENIQKTFQDQTTKTLIEKRTVKFGISPDSYSWADFVRLETLKAIQEKVNASATQQQLNALIQRVEIVELKTAPIINGGVVWAFNKPAIEIPLGWKECTDLRGKTILGFDPNDIDFNLIGKTGGSKTNCLETANLPSFQYSDTRFQPVSNDWRGGGASSPGNETGTNATDTKTYNGQRMAFSILNPYRTVLFIEPNFQ